jgi:hypothetical protein
MLTYACDSCRKQHHKSAFSHTGWQGRGWCQMCRHTYNKQQRIIYKARQSVSDGCDGCLSSILPDAPVDGSTSSLQPRQPLQSTVSPLGAGKRRFSTCTSTSSLQPLQTLQRTVSPPGEGKRRFSTSSLQPLQPLPTTSLQPPQRKVSPLGAGKRRFSTGGSLRGGLQEVAWKRRKCDATLQARQTYLLLLTKPLCCCELNLAAAN